MPLDLVEFEELYSYLLSFQNDTQSAGNHNLYFPSDVLWHPIDFDMHLFISLHVLIVVMVTDTFSWSWVQEAMTTPFVYEPLNKNVRSKAL